MGAVRLLNANGRYGKTKVGRTRSNRKKGSTPPGLFVTIRRRGRR